MDTGSTWCNQGTLIALLLAACLSAAAAAMPCSIRHDSRIYLAPTKEADWTKGERLKPRPPSAADDEPRPKRRSAAASQDRIRPRSSSLFTRKRPRPSSPVQPASAVTASNGEAVSAVAELPTCPFPRARRRKPPRRSRAARPRLPVPRRGRPDLFARHRQLAARIQPHRHPRQRRDLSAVAPDSPTTRSATIAAIRSRSR